MSETIHIILSKDRTPTTLQQNLEREISRRLARLPGLEVTAVPHLYDLPPDGETMDFLRSLSGDLVVFSWLYPRPVFWLLDANGVRGRFGRTSSLAEGEPEGPLTSSHARGDVPDRTIWCFDLRTHAQPGPYMEEVLRIARQPPELAEAGNDATIDVRQREETTHARWYPVVDRSRCTGCLECLNFCLFGVFGLTEADEVLIEQPDACRPGCPACSRICPQGAIMFPQHQDPAIAGDPKASRELLKLDLSQLFRGLAPAELAAAERARALAEQQQAGPESPQTPPVGEDDLDRLIDKLDESGL